MYCGLVWATADLSVDHVQARSRGGDRSGGNLVTACRGCNVRKARRRLAEFLADEPESRANFHRYAAHVWPRHLRELDAEIRGILGRRRGRPGGASEARDSDAANDGRPPMITDGAQDYESRG